MPADTVTGTTPATGDGMEEGAGLAVRTVGARGNADTCIWAGSGDGDTNSARTEMLPCTTVSPSECTTTCPPLGPLASITLEGVNTTDCLARNVTVPLSPTTALLAWMVPLLRTNPP